MMAQTMNVQEAYERGFDLRCNGRYSEAKAQLQQVLDVDPNHCDARWQMGLILGFEGDFEGSLVALSELARLYPTRDYVLYDLAMSQMMLGMNEEACDNFREVLRINPNHEKAAQQVIYCDQ
jgi:tetratricopeptide (TPR) repeat protein